MARKLEAVARKDLAAVVYNETLPVVDKARADSVVFLVNSLAPPKKSELASDHRVERLEIEKVLGRSLMYLIAAVARETVMRHKDEFDAAVFDPELLDLVTAGLSPLDLPEEEKLAGAGECLYRDRAGRIGLMKALIPMGPVVMRVIHTTPSDYRTAA
ncbi:ATP-binding protein [Streptomyces sp. NBC_01717]|uniref:ATP-binding protein n=1 Tax=Streptomyces sp. NBC_01717 TaxID=2975918 RepID=UPI002E307A70|nr:ATP-binding protein [Streptomyces sp. NBC_01717]